MNERKREKLTRPMTLEWLEERRAEGWRPVAIEWERVSPSPDRELTEVPFGLRVAADGKHLCEDADEMAMLRTVLGMIVKDRPMSEIAAELGRRGFRRRSGEAWTQGSVFDLLPRVIEVAPSIYESEAWRRERLRATG
ncbi:MAG: hypothetical protein AAFY88_13560 [Acidobacteriota bacterium]